MDRVPVGYAGDRFAIANVADKPKVSNILDICGLGSAG
jgi:hypothetical protein